MTGLTDTGFTPKTVDEIVTEIGDDVLADLDSEMDLDPEQPLGQIIGIFSSKLGELWELVDTAFGAMDEGAASKTLLDKLMALTGSKRPAASRGVVVLNCTLAAATALPGTAQVAHASDPTNTWTIEEAYTAGASPEVKALRFRSDRDGAVPALAGTLTVIATPVSGWSAVTNPLDAEPGRLEAEDPEARLVRRQELADIGQTSPPALHAALLKVSGVLAVIVEENTGTTVDAYGRPGKSIEAIIWDGITPAATDAAIAKTIYENRSGGIETFGSTYYDYVNALGVVFRVHFNRATQVPITIAMTLTQDPDLPAYSPTDVKAALVAWGNALGPDKDVILERVKAIALSIPGVLDVTSCTIDRGSGPVAANATITKREVSTWDTTRITIT